MLATTTEMLPTTQNMNSSYSMEPAPGKQFFYFLNFLHQMTVDSIFFYIQSLRATFERETQQGNGPGDYSKFLA
jgi:hypothetical protein